eukprot:4931626-Pyramimonas_sp.AAC.1
MSSAQRNAEKYDRPGVIKVATQFSLEYLSTSPASTPLDTDVIHDVPPELSELANSIWAQPFDRIHAHGRRGRILLAAREVRCLLMFAGLTVAFLRGT